MSPMDLDPEGEGDGKGSSSPKSTSTKSASRPPADADQENGLTSSPTHSSSPAPSNPANPKDAELYEQELASINSVLASISPAAARAAVRQNWRKCLLGSSSDESFFLRGLLGRTSDHVITRVLEDDQQRMLEVANEHCKAFLDRAMEVRLESISAKDLVAMLAQARRLGYDEMDLVDADETVVPAVNGRAKEADDTDEEGEEGLQVERPQRAETKAAIPEDEWEKERMRTFRMQQQQQQQYDANEAKRRQIEEHARSGSKRKICPTCGATFLQSAGLTYHISHKVCLRQKPPQVSKFWCNSCQKGFTTSGGLTYHKMNNVCKGHEMAPATSPDAQLRAEEQAAASPRTQPPHHSPPSYPPTSQLFNSLPGSTALPHHQPQPPQPKPSAPHYPNFNTINSPPVPSIPSQPYQSMPPVVPRPMAVSLTPEQLAEMNRELAKEEERFDAQIRALPENLSAAERDVEFRRLKAGSSTRKSIVRRKYGVQVRRSKVAPANSVRTPGGGIDIVMRDSAAPPTTSGFAPINRIAAFRAVPGKASFDGSAPGADGQHAQPSEEHDAKRRRMTTNLPSDMRTPAPYPPQNEADRRHTIDPYRRPNIYGNHQPPYGQQPPYNNQHPDQRPTSAQRQNGIIPPSRPPIYTSTHSHTMPQGSPHLQQHPQQPQHPPPVGAFTSANVDPSRPTAPVAHMGGPPAQSFYVEQDRRHSHSHSHSHSHTHPATNGDASANTGGFGVLKAKKVPVEDAQRVWEAQRDWRMYTGPGPARQAPNPLASGVARGAADSAASGGERPAGTDGVVTNGSSGAFKQGEVVEILSDSSEGGKTPTNATATATATTEKDKDKDAVGAAAETTSGAARVPKEALQGPGAGGVPVHIPVSPITTTHSLRRAAAAPAGDSITVDVNGGGAAGGAARTAAEEESSDGDSDSEIPARRPGSKGRDVRGLSERPEGAVVARGTQVARRGGKVFEGRMVGVRGVGAGKENVAG